MALSADEQRLLDSLTAKANEPAREAQYNSVEKILEYLVRTSSKFTANPQDQEEMLAFLDSVINPSGASGESDGVSAN